MYILLNKAENVLTKSRSLNMKFGTLHKMTSQCTTTADSALLWTRRFKYQATSINQSWSLRGQNGKRNLRKCAWKHIHCSHQQNARYYRQNEEYRWRAKNAQPFFNCKSDARWTSTCWNSSACSIFWVSGTFALFPTVTHTWTSNSFGIGS